MEQIDVANVRIELVVGDIIDQPDVDAIVNAANARLEPGSGVSGAIHTAAGPGLATECRPLAPIAVGDCVITSGHQLPNPYVLHCLGPVYGQEEPADEFLDSCYRRALTLADTNQLSSVAFPAISTGAFGYPVHEAAETALATVTEVAERLDHVRLIRFVLSDEEMLGTHRDALGAHGG